MDNPTQIFVRAHVDHRPAKAKGKYQKSIRVPEPKWPKHALVIDCETTIDKAQALTFGFYRFCRLGAEGKYECLEEGIFVSDDITGGPEQMTIVKDYINANRAETLMNCPPEIAFLTRTNFIEKTFWPAVLEAEAMIVCFNAPFDLSRLALDCRVARKRNEGWSFIMSQDLCPNTGLVRENPFRPRIKITPRDSQSAFIKLTGLGIRSRRSRKRLKPYQAGRFLDLRTLGWALRSQSYSLRTACTSYGVISKFKHEPTGTISPEEIEYCRQDVRATTALLNAMKADYDLHPINLKPDRAVSPASLAKAYLTTMGVTPPMEKFSVPERAHGIAMQAYYGGRAECRIRHTQVPLVYTDFLSQYPTVNTLLGLWSYLTAETLQVEDATYQIRDMLERFHPDLAFDPTFWKQLSFYARIIPSSDVLPVRTDYNGTTTNIGVNPLTSEEPIWYAGPDIIASMLLTGRVPEVVEAIKIVAHGKQSSMKPVLLRGTIEIDPIKNDLFRSMIEARTRVKSDMSLVEEQRDNLSYFLKILANSGAYGLFVQVDPEPLAPGMRKSVHVLSGESHFDTTTDVDEKPGRWYFPMIAALITSGGRLLLARLERSLGDVGGCHVFCDTDSMAIAANKEGGLVPCQGGEFLTAEGQEAIKALSWLEVAQIVNQFKQLNPYDREVVKGSILKIEDVNYHNGVQRQVFGFAVAAKRYALYSFLSEGLEVVASKAHGLGFLYEPYKGFDKDLKVPKWVVEAWGALLRDVLGLSNEIPVWFDLPAMMRFKITKPNVLKVLQTREADMSYRDRSKPFNFVQSPLIQDIGGHPLNVNRNHFTLIRPIESDTAKWYSGDYLNVHDGKSYRLGKPGIRKPSEAEPKTYGDFLRQYRWHPEAKSLAPDGRPCMKRSAGLLKRMSVVAGSLGYIGKETDRRWEQGDDMSLIDSAVTEYRPGETALLSTDQSLQQAAKEASIRQLAKAAGVTENTVKALRRGDRLRKATLSKIQLALIELRNRPNLPAA